MIVRAVVRLLAVGVLCIAGTTCGGTEPPDDPVPGWLPVRLVSPNADDGGVLFSVGGAQIDSVRSSFPDAFVRRTSPTGWRVLVGGALANGTVVAEILVPDTREAAAYTATLEQVARRAPWMQREIAGYSLGVTAGPP